ncbi:MAG TPA: ABC transporter substrate-binding protein, partial [Allosphingosinicella sp.]|nr:ABC transporter substrate-binding protein [Allosphingosinicella sp.]
PREDGAVQLAVPGADDEEDDEASRLPELLLRGEPAAVAVARFAEGDADLVTGGTAGDLPLARAARVPAAQLAFDPAAGLFGLAFSPVQEGPLADAATRRALSMAIDRDALVAGLAVPGLRPQAGLLPPLPDELTAPSAPDWAGAPLPMRRELAARAISGLDAPLRLRVALPEGAGYRLLFAYLRRDWRVIGVEAERVAANAPADLRLIDEVAPAMLASWYLRHFACGAGTVCDPAADLALEAARAAPTQPERQIQLAEADRLMTALVPYIPLCSPIRWSLVSPRLTGFRPNMFARHPAATLIAQEF